MTPRTAGDGAAFEIRVNGEVQAIDARNLRDVLARLGYALERQGIAVAVNGTIVPRGDWAARALSAGDEVEIVGAVQGG